MSLKILKHQITRHTNDNTDIWKKSYGLARLLHATANMHGEIISKKALPKYRNYPHSLMQWVADAKASDIKALQVALSNFKWGLGVYHYLRTCWMINQCTVQTTLIIRKAVQQKSGFSDASQIKHLRDHIKAIEKLAKIRGKNLVWVFDKSPLKHDKPYTFHVHVYSNSKRLLKDAQDFDNLLPFVQTYTVHTRTVSISKPTVDGLYKGNIIGDKTLNSLSYGASKVTGLLIGHIKNDITSATRHSLYHRTVVDAFAMHRGGIYRHWGYTGFGLKG